MVLKTSWMGLEKKKKKGEERGGVISDKEVEVKGVTINGESIHVDLGKKNDKKERGRREGE